MHPTQNLSPQQRTLIERDPHGSLFLEGIAGTGKTTLGVERLAYLIDQGVPASEILILVPQRTLALPYDNRLNSPDWPSGGQVTIQTLGGLSRRMVDIFWPLVAEDAGFSYPDRRPTFLSLESTQYFMARVLAPVIEAQGYFESVTIDRNRLYSQIVDNLNKAALVPFPYTEIGERLKTAWAGDEARRRMYDDVQDAVNRFRAHCLENNLLDFSLQAQIFINRLWHLPQCRAYLTQSYTHLIVDNIEEDTPATHAILNDWLPDSTSALIIYDWEAGYRRFLGANPDTAYELRNTCDDYQRLSESFVISAPIFAFGDALRTSINRIEDATPPEVDPREALIYENHRYYPQVLDWTTDSIIGLINDEGVPPDEIVVIAPFLSDALRFSLMNRLQARGVPVKSHRPSRALREEPAVRALLTLAQIAHPDWKIIPTQFDVAYALMTAIDGLDLVRAQLLAQIVYDRHQGILRPFENIQASVQQRITYVLGERYIALRQWLLDYTAKDPEEFDHFLSHIFGEILSQPGYGFHNQPEPAEAAANLIDSARRFRWTIDALIEGKTLAQEYVEMVGAGIIADQYLRSWDIDEDTPAVLLAPAYTFLMRNTPVDYQFWLNVSSPGWSERVYQPLTHPYVLSHGWRAGRQWTDDDEVATSREALLRLTLGLTRRCRKGIYLGFSELGEQGYEQRGALLEAIQSMLRRITGGVADGV